MFFVQIHKTKARERFKNDRKKNSTRICNSKRRIYINGKCNMGEKTMEIAFKKTIKPNQYLSPIVIRLKG